MTNPEVYAVPGNVTSRNSFGTNYLIKGAGAKLIQTWQDIVTEFPPDLAARLLPPEPKKSARRADAVAALPEDISESARSVFRLIPADEPAHIDALAAATGMPLPELSAALLELEMRELIRQLPGKCFVRKL